MAKIFKMLKNEKGATAIEYGLIAALDRSCRYWRHDQHRHQARHDLQQRFEQPLSSFAVSTGSGGAATRRRFLSSRPRTHCDRADPRG